MGRDKRKNRLDKGGASGGDFVGFGAFAAPSAASSLKASPVYTGSDGQLTLVFKKITQKRDAVTKARALNELQAYFEQDCNRKEQVDALSHLVFIYHSKIAYDDSSSVRAAAISCMNAAYARLPKAWSTLVTEQQPEVSGMMFCGRADPAAEVRASAANFHYASQQGVVPYVTRILGYDRPRSMYDALFARKQETEPPDRDELDERFERIVGTSLGGMNLWIQAHPETEENRYIDQINDGILWSTMNSSKSSLRIKTYSLLATLCQHAKSLVYGQVGSSALPKLLTNALTQEKESSNVSPLLEVLLLYLSNFLDGNPWRVVEAPLLVKNLGKQLKKACHGASASQWGPMMLPILASLSDESFGLQLQLLKNMETGMEAAIGPGDSLLIGTALAECASFFLMRREDETKRMEPDVAKQFAHYWLQVLGQHLSSEARSSMAKSADESLLQNLSDSFYKFDQSSFNRPHSAIYHIREWFWGEGMEPTVMKCVGYSADERFAELLNCVMVLKQQDVESVHQSHANAVIRKRFYATLSTYQGKSDATPDSQAFDLMIASIRYCSAPYIFAEASLELFLMNDLLRWIVMDTSSLSARKGRRNLVELDFTLLRECLLSITSPFKQKSMWETILREVIAAECDLELLSNGILVLLKESEGEADAAGILRCETLDDFATKVGEESILKRDEHFLKEFVDDMDDESYEEDAQKALIFLETCVGLNPVSASILVSLKVVHRWAEVAAPTLDEHVLQLGGNVDMRDPLITALLALVSRGERSVLTTDDAERIALESWRRGGKQWNETTLLLLNEEDAPEMQLCSAKHIVTRGAAELRDLLESFRHSEDADLVNMALVCHVWSERAYRILDLCSNASGVSNADNFPQPSLALIGLAGIETWSAAISGDHSVTYLYLCLVYILQQFQSQADRLDLFLKSSDSSEVVATSIFLAISDATSGIIVDPVTRRDKNCAFVLSLLGGKDIPLYLRQSWCKEVMNDISANMAATNQDNYTRVTRGVSVLSELLFTLFGRIVVDEGLDVSTCDLVVANDVCENDELWYVTDEHGKRAKAKVVKIHSDDFPRLYFTIRVEQSNQVQERQTVAERLRRLPEAPNTCGDAVLASHFSANEKEERIVFGDCIFEKMVKPVLMPLDESKDAPVIDAASELLNIIISHCGLIGKEGIASTRYEVFKLLTSLQARIAQDLKIENTVDTSVQAMKALGLAMGVGNVVSASKNNFKLMKFIPDECTRAIVQYYENDDVESTVKTDIDRAAIEWLAISAKETSDESLHKDASILLYELSARVLGKEEKTTSEDIADSVLIMRAVQNAESSGLPDEASVDEREKQIIKKLVKSFACDWETAVESANQFQILDVSERSNRQLPEWYEPFRSFMKAMIKQRAKAVALAAKSNCDALVENLFCWNKRLLAFRLLNVAADGGDPIHLDYFIGDEAKERLEGWQEGLIEEEAEELEDDIGLIGQWIPEAMMLELESWADEDHQRECIDETNALGSMLCWLSFLSLVDSAAAVDVRFRGSTSAYLDHINVNYILGTSLSYLKLEKDRNFKQSDVITMEQALEERSCLEVSKISGLVMFRTVEAFPTLFKRWWDDKCPKNSSAAVSQFVETKIAPLVLQRELARINSVVDMGEMTVSGSIVSREVTATYAQDECQLSIAIQVPPNFPLRNVEVDGRLTLGIPEKRWKRWALQIRQMLNNQDGTLLDALMLWKENVDKDFAGLEPCPVCYSILSVKTHELPNLQCNTCNNCFHSSCLYKWFHSSGKSQCVLCQQPWSGTRIQK